MKTVPILFATKLVILFLVVGCATTPVVSDRDPSPTTIALDVQTEEWAMGDLDKKLHALLRQQVLEAGVGVPVEPGNPADLTLRVRLTDTNWTMATAYEWSLVENSAGRVLTTGSETSAFGHSPDAMAEAVLTALVAFDTAPYASNTDAPHPLDHKIDEAPPSSTAPPSATDGSGSFAVIVGVERYRNELATADAAEADAKAFAEYAQTTLGVPETQIKLLLGQRATRTDIAGAVQEWLPKNAVEEGGKVYFFFSGHGAPNVETGEAYLVPWDADPAYLKTGGIAIAELQQWLAGLKGQEVFIFLDACFSGSGARSVLAKGTRPLVPVKDVGNAPAVYTLTAASGGETTGLHSSREHGLFTMHLLDGLGGAADANGDTNISFGELSRHLANKVSVEARRDNREQTPTATAPTGASIDTVTLVRGLTR